MTPGFERPLMERVAEALANARAARRGVPAVAGVLDMLPPQILAELRAEATAVLDVLGHDELLAAAENAHELLVALAAHRAPNGQLWADYKPMRADLRKLRDVIAAAGGHRLLGEDVPAAVKP